MGFVHLHVHSHFSLLDGAVTIPQLVGAAKEYGMPALALTDHGNLFGAVQFFKACKAAGLKPILGMEAYVAPASRLEKKRLPGGAFYHFILLARNEEGYANLMRLSSISYIDGFYYRPRIDKEILARHSKGLIGMSACLSSEINRAAVEGSEEDLRRQIEAYRGIFEPGCFFLELQRNGLQEQERVLEKVPPLAREYGVPLVATNDIHYLRRDDARAQEVHLCINTGQTMDDSDRMRFNSDQFYFRSEAEMRRVLGDFPEAVDNTLAVAEMCTLELDFSKTHLPLFVLGDGRAAARAPQEGEEETPFDADGYFRELCVRGCRARYPDFDSNAAIRERLEHEMGVIQKMRYVSYFLIVWDFIRYAREQQIPVGPGRGSAAGSMVAYALGITNVDPLEYDLLFERFLNADRISMPDIDIDFCMDGREKVIEYVKRKYGDDRVCQIITFGTMAARAVLRDVGRALNVPLPEVDAIAKKIPAGPKVSLEESLNADPDLTKLRDSDPRLKELFDVALRLEGLNRHCSTHAAGVVISDAPLLDTVPLYRNGEDITTQFTMEDLEAVGMLKMDFLGLKTLTVIDRCVRLVGKSRGVKLDIDAIPLDDKGTYDLLCRGDAVAVFQLESKGMRDLLRRLKPDRFEDIIALLALYRPGPLEGGMVDTYVQRKHGQEPIHYDHPCLEPILRETNGVILYQEQVMRIANVMAGFTLNEADTLRKAMGKKKKEIMEKFKEKFVSGAARKGIDPRLATHTFDLIEFFAGYGFNKSHSTAYALVSYQTAFLKANYPTEFLAAVMSCEMSNTDNLVEYLEEARRMGIEILPPHINRSEKAFSVEDRKIWYGLEAVKGIGGKVVDAILEARERGGPFRSIFDLCERVDGAAINKTVLEGLTSCGALDCFGQRRSQLFAVVEHALQRGSEARRDRKAGQTTLFDLFGAPVPASASPGDAGGREAGNPSQGTQASQDGQYPDLPEWSDAERLSREKESLGFYLTGHPLLKWESLVRKYRTHTIADVARLADGTPVTVGVQVAKLTKKVSKKTGEPFWIALVEDLNGTLEIFVTKELHEAAKDALREESLVFLKGTVRYRDTTASLRVDQAIPFEEAPARLTEDLSLVIPIDGGPEAEDLIFRLKGLLQKHQGKCPVYLVFKNEAGERAVLLVGTENYITPDTSFLEAADGLCGRDRVFVNRMRGRNP
ncbi:MAG: DNA polymerase III subunit alpha [Planctomycetes bacterium]|nr:DNA polymerase III subunit alpha [Planctomycetota bacterium]